MEIRTVGELRAELEQFADDTPVRIAHQPKWPFEYSVGEVVGVGNESGTAGVVYIGEGEQLRYLANEATEALGW